LKLIMKKEKLTCIASEFSFLSCFPLSYFPSLHSMPHIPEPSIARCWSVLHNTQINKTSYPSLQAFLKSWQPLKTKIKTLKTCYVHTRILPKSLPIKSQNHLHKQSHTTINASNEITATYQVSSKIKARSGHYLQTNKQCRK
jgi:hypothetical protein